MTSLDKKIFDKNSQVAKRMVEYGKKDELFIIIPHPKEQELNLSDAVHVWGTGGNKLQQFFRLKKLGKEIIKKNKIEQITTQDPFYIGKIGWLLKRKSKINLEVQLHGDFFSAKGGSVFGGSNYYKRQNFLKYLLGKFIIKKADKLRVVGERIRQSLIKLGIEEKRIEIKPIFVDTEKIKNYEPKIDLHQKYPGYEKTFLVLARLEKVKNVGWLVNVFKDVIREKKDYLLLIVGDGKELEEIKLQITNYKLQKNIKIENWTSDPISYLKTTDCLLFPSLSEGYGLIPMEAHVACTPIIMNDVGVANYELKPSEKVKILPIDDKDAWKKAILEI